MDQLTISARNAGQVELEKYCPRCCWYMLRMRNRAPFQFGMPGIMFYMEKAEKEYLASIIRAQGKLPESFGPFAGSGAVVPLPSVMETLHEPTNVIVTARPDLILRSKGGNLVLIDLKTARSECNWMTISQTRLITPSKTDS
jgi:hypothetical protein